MLQDDHLTVDHSSYYLVNSVHILHPDTISISNNIKLILVVKT